MTEPVSRFPPFDRWRRRWGRRAASVRFAVPRFTNKEGKSMGTPLSLPDDSIATIPLLFKTRSGHVHAPVAGGAANSSDTSVATAALSDDGGSVVITAIADGQCTVSYSNGSLSDTLAVQVAAPAAYSVELDAEDAKFVPKPEPTAVGSASTSAAPASGGAGGSEAGSASAAAEPAAGATSGGTGGGAPADAATAGAAAD